MTYAWILNTRTAMYSLCFVTAIKQSNVAMTRLPLLEGAGHQHRVQGGPPLFYTVQSEACGPQLVQILLDYGADITLSAVRQT